MKDLKERVIRGGIAKVGSQAGNFLLRVGSLMVLARLLDPKDFGLLAMVTAFSGVFSLFKDAGLSTASIQRATISEEQSSTLFWINVLVGCILALLLVASAPLFVAFYREPRLLWIAVALAADFIFTGVAVQHSALLQRQMRFTAIAAIDIVSLAVGVGIAITMAATGWGYWALVAQTIAFPVVNAIGLWVIVGWIPGMPRRRVGVGSMLRFGGTVTLNSLVVYIAYNLEKVLLGRFWGAESLGIYGRAYQLINIPTENLNSAVSGVAFAGLSRVQDDPERFRRYFLKGYALVIGMTIPITVAGALFADDLILVALGPKWKDSVLIFRLLTPTILVFALINPMWWVLASAGLVGRSLRIALVIAPLTISAYILGIPYGATGVACAYSVAMIVWVIPHLAWCVHGTAISFRDLMEVVRRPLISGVLAATLSFGVQVFVGRLSSPLLKLSLGVGTMLVCYLGILLYVMGQKGFYMDLLTTLKKGSSTEKNEAELHS